MPFSSRFARNCLRAVATIALIVPVVCGAVDVPRAQATEPAARAVRAGVSKLPAMDGSGVYEQGLSGFGLLARLAATGRLDAAIAKARVSGKRRLVLKDEPPFTDEDDGTLIPGGQAEYSIAVDATGNNVVVGFNDTRGFSLNPISVSGYAYSSNGGTTFTDGGQLPSVTLGNRGATNYPQVFGDADIKYVPGGAGCQFIYSSIEVVGLGPAPSYTGTAQTLSVHRSTDCGHTWTGPFEVTPATNPNGAIVGGNAADAADKEFIDVDPETNRVLVSWSNFSTNVEISTTFSDNIMSATPPTWSSRVVVTPGSGTLFNTGSMPRFAGNGSANAYVTWSRKDFTESTPYGGDACGNTMFSRSTNNGVTWSAPIKLHTGGICAGGDFWPMDQIPGDDRIHSFPSMAVDTTAGSRTGWIYVVYAGNDSKDGGDINFVKSTDAGVSFSAPVKLNARPGSDRSQWFPYVTVASTGRVYATWYDQQAVSTGDLTETLMTYSDDGGATWTRPAPITDRPFHAGFGNDTGQPNIGDYIGATTNGGNLYAAWAGTPPTILYTDGQPSGSFTVPDLYFSKTSTAKAALKLGTVSSVEVAGFSNGNGNIDPGERVNVTIPLTNFVTNASVGAASYSGVSGTLTSTTPGVSIVTGTQAYGTVAPGATSAPAGPYVVQLAGGFVPGTRIDFSLVVTTTGGGSTTLLFKVDTGTPVAATIFAEDFNSTAPGALPAGWTTLHGGGTNTVPWTTSNSFCGTATNALFHVEANDAANPTRFERALSPSIVVPSPAGQNYVTVEFDVCYNTEDDPDFNVLAYDGATMRITDQTSGRTLRSELLEAMSDPLTTGAINHFPKHLPRSNSAAYFQDMSVWAGDSGGFKHVFARIYGMQGSTVQLRSEYTQDSGGICTDAGHTAPCGVMIDNFVVKSVTFNAALVDLTIPVATATPAIVPPGTNVTYNFTVAASNSGFNAANVVFTDPLPATLTFVSAIVPAGWTCVTPAVGTNGTITCTNPSVASNTSSAFTFVVNVPGSTAGGVTFNNTATVATDSPETSTANNSGTATFVTQSGVPDLTITKTHVGNFSTGQTGKTYTITVTNTGTVPTVGTVTVTDTLPAGLTATAIGGTGWVCTLASLTCTRSDALAPAASYPAITLTVNVASNAPATVVNSVTVSGGGETNVANDSASDTTTVIGVPDLTIVSTHVGNFAPGSIGASIILTVSNVGGGPTVGTVTVVDTLSSGLTATAISGTGWTCTLATLTCTRSDPLAAGASYPVITITVNVASNAPGTVTNSATVSGGGDINAANNTGTDVVAVAVVNVPALSPAMLLVLSMLLGLMALFASRRRRNR